MAARSVASTLAEVLSSATMAMVLPVDDLSGKSFSSCTTKSPVVGCVVSSQSLPQNPKPQLRLHQMGWTDHPKNGTLLAFRYVAPLNAAVNTGATANTWSCCTSVLAAVRSVLLSWPSS